MTTEPIPHDILADPPWERFTGESTPAWDAFRTYRDMPDRSLSKVARELGKSKTLMDRWSRAHRWQYRTVAYDAEQDRLRLQEQNQAILDMARRHAQQAMAGINALMLPALAVVQKQRSDPELIANLSMARLDDLLNLLARTAGPMATLMQAERLARGEPTDITESRGANFNIEVREETLDTDRLGRILAILGDAGVLTAGADPTGTATAGDSEPAVPVHPPQPD